MSTNKKSLRRPLLVSFSGLDGSGKSTQIEHLRSVIAGLGLSDQLLTFWGNVVVGTLYRESFVHKMYGSEKGIGAPDKPVNRRDKNVRNWYLNIARHGLYLVDALHLCWVVAKAKRSGADVIIMDRYTYDELANLPLENAFTRMFVKFVHAFVPRPNVAYLLDADPVAARARKPEYPVDFMHICRRAYFNLAQMLGTMTVIPPLPLSDAKKEVEHAFFRALSNTEMSDSAKFDAAPAA